jgi:hypothetical protein
VLSNPDFEQSLLLVSHECSRLRLCVPSLHIRECGSAFAATIPSQARIKFACAMSTLVALNVWPDYLGNLHMAPGRATFLRQASGVLRDDSFAFNMRSHSQELPDRDDTSAADTRYDNTIGRLALRWQYWFR